MSIALIITLPDILVWEILWIRLSLSSENEDEESKRKSLIQLDRKRSDHPFV